MGELEFCKECPDKLEKLRRWCRFSWLIDSSTLEKILSKLLVLPVLVAMLRFCDSRGCVLGKEPVGLLLTSSILSLPQFLGIGIAGHIGDVV